MLIQHTPDAYEKLQLLVGMATDDILSVSYTHLTLPTTPYV